jgi:hypothetical protein
MSSTTELTRRQLMLTSPALALALAPAVASAQQPRGKIITRAQYDQYIALYNAGDPAFAQFYRDDAVMETVPPLQGAAAIVQFTKELRTYLTEHITIEFFVSDEHGAASQMLGEFRCIRDMPLTAFGGLFGKAVKAGQVFRQRGIILYGVKDGKFQFIRASPPIIVQDWS